MNLNKLQNKKICILGLGIENYALVKFLLKKKIACEITICDARKEIKKAAKLPQGSLASLNYKLGRNYDRNLDRFGIIFRSPGCPLFNPNLVKAKKMGVKISSPMKLFFELCSADNIIGVTGTKGKGTTASLIYHILKKAGRRVWLGGNIGVAPFAFLEKIKKNDWIVLELSSFQLEDMRASPHIAVITNFTKEHLASADLNNPNYHKTMQGYWNAKLNIIKWQKKGSSAIINNKLKAGFAGLAFKGKKIYFTKSELPSKLIGEHNKENIAAAVEAVKKAGVKQDIIKKAVASFNGLEHRLEYVAVINGVKYYNDSFATTPESAITALESFSQPIVLIAGGAEKKSNFKKLARKIKRQVKFIVLLNGRATHRLKKELIKISYASNKTKLVYNIKDAVSYASRNADNGDVILLSPACASFGMFKNYKERGELFKGEIKKLK